MIALTLDTATPDTVVGLACDDGSVTAARHTPGPGERPGHSAQVLLLAARLLADAQLTFADVGRIGVGVGPGTFTGLRIGVATGRALAQATGADLVAVPTLTALALGVLQAGHAGPVLAVLDARRGEAFAAAHDASGAPMAAPAAVAPADLPALLTGPGPWLAAGDGAVRFRSMLESAGAEVPGDVSDRHRISARTLCRLTLAAGTGSAVAGTLVAREALVPAYVRAPDAVPRPRTGA